MENLFPFHPTNNNNNKSGNSSTYSNSKTFKALETSYKIKNFYKRSMQS